MVGVSYGRRLRRHRGQTRRFAPSMRRTVHPRRTDADVIHAGETLSPRRLPAHYDRSRGAAEVQRLVGSRYDPRLSWRVEDRPSNGAPKQRQGIASPRPLPFLRRTGRRPKRVSPERHKHVLPAPPSRCASIDVHKLLQQRCQRARSRESALTLLMTSIYLGNTNRPWCSPRGTLRSARSGPGYESVASLSFLARRFLWMIVRCMPNSFAARLILPSVCSSA